jgi:hypothetical protein
MRIRHLCETYAYDPRFRTVRNRSHSEIGPDYVNERGPWWDWTLGGDEVWEGHYED